jgi:ribosomal-protein-alanine N-acetyltransferase
MSIILETKRLIVKTLEKSDFDDLLALRTDPDVMRYIGTGKVQTKEQVQEFLNNFAPYWEKYGLGFFAVFEKSTNQFVGQAGLFHLGFNVN